MPMMLVLYVPPLLLLPLAPASGGDAAAACGGSGVSHAAVAHEARLRCGCKPQKRRETDEGGNRSVNACGMLRGGRWWRGCRRSCRSARDAQQRKKHGQQAAAASPRHQCSDWLTLMWLKERERFDGSSEHGGGGGRNEESGGDAEREAAVGNIGG